MKFPNKVGATLLCYVGIGCLSWLIGAKSSPPDYVAFLSVGQGDCTVFTTDGHTVLIDAGPASPYQDAGEKIVVPWLKVNGIRSVDAIFLSHPDEDHVGGAPSIMKTFPSARLVVSDQFKGDPEMLRHLRTWGVPAEEVAWLPRRAEVQLGGAKLFLDSPDKPPSGEANDGSMFVRIEEGEGSVVLSGDAPKSVERSIEADRDWKSEIVHVGHHGSRTATDPSWLQAVRPTFAVISVGRNNRYGHPNKQTLETLDANHVKTLRTDRDGTIIFNFDGRTFTLR